jgi:hypothetical protein
VDCAHAPHKPGSLTKPQLSNLRQYGFPSAITSWSDASSSSRCSCSWRWRTTSTWTACCWSWTSPAKWTHPSGNGSSAVKADAGARFAGGERSCLARDRSSGRLSWRSRRCKRRLRTGSSTQFLLYPSYECNFLHSSNTGAVCSRYRVLAKRAQPRSDQWRDMEQSRTLLSHDGRFGQGVLGLPTSALPFAGS